MTCLLIIFKCHCIKTKLSLLNTLICVYTRLQLLWLHIGNISPVQNIYLTYSIHHKHLDYTTPYKYNKYLADASYLVRCWTKMSVNLRHFCCCATPLLTMAVHRDNHTFLIFNDSKQFWSNITYKLLLIHEEAKGAQKLLYVHGLPPTMDGG